MMEITAEIRALIDKAAAGVELAGDEYIDPADGLIHCKKCGGQRQTVVPCFGKPGYFMPRCICQCQREAEEQRKTAEERQRRMERIKRRKAQGLQDRYLYDYTFSNDNGQNPLMDKAHAYVENWKEAYKSNIGLLLFGDVGTGKSFFAGCIANALTPATVQKLSQVPNIIGVKDSSGNFDNILQYIEKTRGGEKPFTVLSGNDSLILWTLLAGGKGAIAACANVFPHTMVSIYEKFAAGDIEGARKAQDSIRPFRDTFKFGNPNTIVKLAVKELGYPVGTCRAPFNSLSPAGFEALRATLKACRDNGLY